MSANPQEPKPAPPGGLQSMLARLRGMVQALRSPTPEATPAGELLPTWDTGATADAASPAAAPAAAPDSPGPASGVAAQAATATDAAPTSGAAEGLSELSAISATEVQPAPALPPCPYCKAPRKEGHTYCDDCGWIFPAVEAPAAADPSGAAPRIRDRYELGASLGQRGDCVRFRATDHGAEDGTPVPVVVLRAPAPATVEAAPAGEAAAAESPTEAAPVDAVPSDAPWPGLAWERALLERVQHPAFPQVLDVFTDGAYEYLVEELPTGQLLWDAWDDPEATAAQRFTWLRTLAEGLHRLHQHGAIVEALRPDIVVVPGDTPRLTDLSDLLPLPLPPDPPIRATHYTAPELVLTSDRADARSDLYSFGAMLYALHLGRELTELDFELQGVPKAFIQRFPDAHPLFARLITKTFCREPGNRFPTEEAAAGDPTGFAELIRVLDDCRRTLGHARLEIGAWTTTGIVRTGNEDAFAVVHATEGRENDLGDAALVLLADGMGGSEAGEVAAALAVQTLRKTLLEQKPFRVLAGDAQTQATAAGAEADAHWLDVEACKLALAAAMREANRVVYSAARGAAGRRGMGCTAEAVYLSGRHVIVAHVGDSRTYLLHRGELTQLTTDQTWVNRMVALGSLTPEEAEKHPRRSELQQAIGGHADVEPAVYQADLHPGDWVLVCSDGITNHASADVLREMLLSGVSAESVARRLVNYVNLHGATDNATVVVVRAT